MASMKTIHDPNYIEIINRLKQVRKSKKIGQEDLAEKLGIDQSHVSKIETFVRRLDLIELRYWLDALEYSVEDFMREIGWIE